MIIGVAEYFFIGTLFAVYGLCVSATKWFLENIWLGQLASTAFVLLTGTIVFGWTQIGQTLVAATIMWSCHRYLKRYYVPISWTFMFVWLTWLNFDRTNWFTPSWALHVSGPVMLMLIKYTSLSADENISLVNWLGWTYFLPSFFTGPTLSWTEYAKFIKEPRGPVDLSFSTSIILEAIWYLPFVFIGNEMFPIEKVAMFDSSIGMFNRVLFLWMALWCIRCKYYFVWKLAEASYSWTGLNKKNVDVSDLERPDRSFYGVLSSWNMCAANWLKNHVYTPVHDYTKNERLAILVTNITSAAWHGLYPGYFVTFIGIGLCTTVGRLIHKNITPAVSRSPKIVQAFFPIVMMVFVSVCVCTVAIPFQVFTFHLIWESWKGIYFIGHIWLGVMTIIALLMAPKMVTQPNHEKAD